MNDSDFRLLVEEITGCEKTENKVQLIRSNFFSLHDYIDLLSSDGLFGSEYTALFKTFSDVELAILAKIVFYEELRDGSFDLSSIVCEKAAESEWEEHYIAFLQSMSRERIDSKAQWIREIDYEEIKFD